MQAFSFLIYLYKLCWRIFYFLFWRKLLWRI